MTDKITLFKGDKEIQINDRYDALEVMVSHGWSVKTDETSDPKADNKVEPVPKDEPKADNKVEPVPKDEPKADNKVEPVPKDEPKAEIKPSRRSRRRT